jgi:hypothetical protein
MAFHGSLYLTLTCSAIAKYIATVISNGALEQEYLELVIQLYVDTVVRM